MILIEVLEDRHYRAVSEHSPCVRCAGDVARCNCGEECKYYLHKEKDYASILGKSPLTSEYFGIDKAKPESDMRLHRVVAEGFTKDTPGGATLILEEFDSIISLIKEQMVVEHDRSEDSITRFLYKLRNEVPMY